MKIADIIRPEIAPACDRIFGLFSNGSLKLKPQEVEIFGTRILFTGNPVPSVTVKGSAVVCTWPEGAKIDVSALPDRLDPSVRQVEIYHDRAVVVTGYGRIVLRS